MSATSVTRYAALFRAESVEHLAAIDAALLALEQAETADAHAEGHAGVVQEHTDTLFRGVHTIKGMAGAMGYVRVEEIAHALESRGELLRRGVLAPDAAALALLFDGVDALRAAVEACSAEGATDAAAPSDDAALTALLERLRAPVGGPTIAPPTRTAGDTAPREHSAAGQAPVAALRDAMPTPATVHTTDDERPLQQVDVQLTADCPLKGVRAMIVLTRLRALGTVQGTTPTLERWQDADFDGRLRVLLRTTASADDLAQAVYGAGEVARAEVKAPAPAPAAGAFGARAAAGLGVAGARSELRGSGLRSTGVRAPTRTVRLDAQHLDTLLELTGELVVTRDRLLRAADSAPADRELRRAARDTARLVTALQSAVLEARLMPAADVFDRFPRLVRDVARELGKEVTLVVEGRELEVDRALLDAIGDPILHLLRNALDHGVESRAAREAAGKPPVATLTLRAVRERAALRIEVRDNGRGIDRAAVLARARAQGLAVPPSLDDDAELLRLVAHPGLTTAASVTSLSGRGVGVDVVQTRVRALGGQLDLQSVAGVGTTFTLRLPSTVAITRALLVEVGGRPFAIPAVHVEEVLAWHPTLRVTRPEGPAVTIRDEVVPLVALGERFGLPRSSGAQEDEAHLAIVEQGGRRAALLVDALVAQQDIVVKPLDLVRGSAPWFAGATVLGDGRAALIVDVGACTAP